MATNDMMTSQRPDSVTHSKDAPLSRFLRGASWVFAGTVIAQAINIAGTLLVARFIGKLAFGQFGMIQSTALMFASIAGAGFGITATRFVSLYRSTNPDRAGRVLGMLTFTTACTGVLFAVALLTCSSSLAQHAFNASGLSTALSLGSLYVAFVTMNGFQLGALAGLEAFKESAFGSMVQAAFNAICVVLFAHLWGLYGAIVALNLSGLAGYLLLHKILADACRKRGINITYHSAWKEYSAFVSFGLPAAVAGIVGNIAIWGCYAITANASNGFKELGAISAANNLRQAILFVPGIVNRVMLPINCNQHGRRQPIREIILRQFYFTVIFAIIAALIMIVAAPYALRLSGKEFAGDNYVVILFLCVAVLEVAAASLGQVLVIRSRMWLQAANMALWGIVLFCVSFALMHSYRPAIAVGDGYLAAWIISIILYGICTYKLLSSKQSESLACEVL